MSNNLMRGGGNVGKSVEDRTNWGSLEDIHNAVHVLTGGTDGHMSSTDTSAFDPVFWLRKYNLTHDSFANRIQIIRKPILSQVAQS